MSSPVMMSRSETSLALRALFRRDFAAPLLTGWRRVTRADGSSPRIIYGSLACLNLAKRGARGDLK
ncbi:hypothetical protein ABZ372_46045, partial [Streptomyces sp. NPDC005921]